MILRLLGNPLLLMLLRVVLLLALTLLAVKLRSDALLDLRLVLQLLWRHIDAVLLVVLLLLSVLRLLKLSLSLHRDRQRISELSRVEAETAAHHLMAILRVALLPGLTLLRRVRVCSLSTLLSRLEMNHVGAKLTLLESVGLPHVGLLLQASEVLNVLFGETGMRRRGRVGRLLRLLRSVAVA